MADPRGPVWIQRALLFLSQGVWSADLDRLSLVRRILYRILRVLFLAGRGFVEDRSLFRASGLAYITILSLVPLLAFCFSAAKGLGAYEHMMSETIEPFLDRTFGPDETNLSGEQVSELRSAVDQLFAFVEATNVGKLGVFGLVFLAYAVIKLLSTIERSFNDIWGVRRARTLLRKVSDYLSLVIVVPILLTVATAAMAALRNAEAIAEIDQHWGIGDMQRLVFKVLPLFSVWVGFGFLYLFMPNTRTRILSSLIGGIAGGSLWTLVQILHVKFQVGVANYNALYSGFAAFPIFLLWIYMSWVTVLFGAHFAFAHQNQGAYRQIARSRHHDQAFKEVLALRVLTRIGTAFLVGQEPRKTQELADELEVPDRSIREVLQLMTDAGLVAPVEESYEEGCLPARDLARIRIADVIDAIAVRKGPVDYPPTSPADAVLDAIRARFEGELDGSPANLAFDEVVARGLEAQDRDARPKGWRFAGDDPGVHGESSDQGSRGESEARAPARDTSQG